MILPGCVGGGAASLVGVQEPAQISFSSVGPGGTGGTGKNNRDLDFDFDNAYFRSHSLAQDSHDGMLSIDSTSAPS